MDIFIWDHCLIMILLDTEVKVLMGLHVVEAESVIRVELQATVQHLDALLRYFEVVLLYRDFPFSFLDVFSEVTYLLAVEGQLPCEQLEVEAADGPYICFAAVFLAHDYLWRHEKRRATEGSSDFVIFQLPCESQICNL